MAKIELAHVKKRYKGGNEVIKDFSLQVREGEFLILVGPSGCGKSTLLRMIAGLEDISHGELWIDDEIENYTEPKDRNLAMVFQNYALYPHMSVYENMAFSLKVKKEKKEVVREKVTTVAKMLNIEPLLDRRPAQLSGGQKQRVAIGNAIIQNPRVLLMDEPLSNLDAKLRAQMRVELARLHRKMKTTTIYVTHDQTEAMTLGTRIVVMKDGEIQQVDTPARMYQYPANKFVAGFIGTPSMNFMEAQVLEKEEGISLLVGEYHLPLKKEQQRRIKEAKQKKLILGVRPEDVYEVSHEEVGEEKCFGEAMKVHVSARELLGAQVLITFDLYGQQYKCILPASSTMEKNQTAEICFDVNKCYFFDVETEVSI